MKACNIFKTESEYKIVTQSMTEDGFLLSVLPAFVIGVDCSNDELRELIVKSLNSSQANIKTPKRDDYPILQKQVLQAINEKSYSALYKKTNSCDIRLENNTLSIFPEKLFTLGKPSDGLTIVKEEKVEFNEFSELTENIINTIREKLNIQFR